jgi:uroporphyrinogen-III synthase
LASGLRERGGHVERVQLYSTSPARLSDELAARVRAADAITFASASSATFLRKSLGERSPAEATRLCAIGPQAAAAVEAAFGRCDSRAESPSIEALAAAVVEALS